MATFNVNHSQDDPFYRYKMAPVKVKFEGKHGRSRSVFLNITDIAQSLCRPPTLILKYISHTLGVQTHIDCDKRYIINGHHTFEDLQSLLKTFISTYVLCKTCFNPDTYLIVKSKKVKLLCTACGSSFTFRDEHKFIRYIISHPPSTKNYIQDLKKRKKQEERKSKQNDSFSGCDFTDSLPQKSSSLNVLE